MRSHSTVEPARLVGAGAAGGPTVARESGEVGRTDASVGAAAASSVDGASAVRRTWRGLPASPRQGSGFSAAAEAPLTVLKFGSSILAGEGDVPRAVHEIYRFYRDGHRVLAVVSAFAGATERLIAAARQFGDGLDRKSTRLNSSHRR